MKVAQRLKRAVKKVTAGRPAKYTLEDLGLTPHVYDGRKGHIFSRRSPNNTSSVGYITFETDGKKILKDLLDAAFHAGVNDEANRRKTETHNRCNDAARAAMEGAVATVRALGLDPDDYYNESGSLDDDSDDDDDDDDSSGGWGDGSYW